MNPIVVWDVLGTLVEDPYPRVAGWLGMTASELAAVKDPQAWFAFETGAIDQAAYAAGFFRDRRAWEAEQLFVRLRASYAWRDGSRELLAELRTRGIEQHVCSNYPRWYLWIEERLQLSRYLPWSFVSCNTGQRKPASAAFEHVLDSLKVDASCVWFVDDQAANRAAAEACGMRAFDPQSMPALREELLTSLPD